MAQVKKLKEVLRCKNGRKTKVIYICPYCGETMVETSRATQVCPRGDSKLYPLYVQRKI